MFNMVMGTATRSTMQKNVESNIIIIIKVKINDTDDNVENIASFLCLASYFMPHIKRQ